jgi:hypothetical protein
MNNCTCGKRVRLRGYKMTCEGKKGIHHWIEHIDGTKICPAGVWGCNAFKPYKTPREYENLIARWNSTVAQMGAGGGAI